VIAYRRSAYTTVLSQPDDSKSPMIFVERNAWERSLKCEGTGGTEAELGSKIKKKTLDLPFHLIVKEM